MSENGTQGRFYGRLKYKGMTPLVTIEQAEAYKDECVRLALEQAAKVVDVEIHNARQEHYHPGLVGALEECATEVRALAPSKERT
jgi:hypothetical protein